MATSRAAKPRAYSAALSWQVQEPKNDCTGGLFPTYKHFWQKNTIICKNYNFCKNATSKMETRSHFERHKESSGGKSHEGNLATLGLFKVPVGYLGAELKLRIVTNYAKDFLKKKNFSLFFVQ